MLMNIAATKTVATAVLGLIRAITANSSGDSPGAGIQGGCAPPHFITADEIRAVEPPTVDVPPTMEPARPVGPWVINLVRANRVPVRDKQCRRRPADPVDH
jgi:hypothetical protein